MGTGVSVTGGVSAVDCGVPVGITSVAVKVAVGWSVTVAVNVLVKVAVGWLVAVLVNVGEGCAVAVEVNVAVGASVAVLVKVAVGVKGTSVAVLVGVGSWQASIGLMWQAADCATADSGLSAVWKASTR